MTYKIYNKTKKFVIDSFNKADKREQIEHFTRTVYWLKKLKPNVDEALLTAAISHDIERAYRSKEMANKGGEVGYANPAYYRDHEERGAEIIVNFLKQQKADTVFINKVSKLIARHEEGGDNGQNLLKDADSISFF